LSTNNDIKNYSADDISRYWQGKLTSEEMHAMERAAMDDPFLADAMEGYSTAQPQTVANDLAELRERLQERSSHKRGVPIYRRWWRIAAAIILLAVASFLTYQLLDSNTTADNLVQATEEAKAPNETALLKDSLAPIQNQTIVSDTLIENRAVLNPSNTVTGSGTPANSQFRSEKNYGNVSTDAAPKMTVPDLTAYKKQADTVNKLMDLAKENVRNDSILVAKTESERNARVQENATVYRNNVPSNQAPTNRDDTRNYYLNNFSGRVVDNDRNAIPQASLRVNNNNQLAVTDNNGYFNIRSGDSLLDLSVASAGYQSRNLTLRSNQPSDVVLDPVPQKKGGKEGYADKTEVKKVSAKSKDDDKSLKGYPMEAEPVGGWEQYNKYLAANNRLLADSSAASNIEVVVLFSVAKNGRLSSFDIAKSGGKELDAEAIRLIKEGPAWKVTKDRKTKARVIVRF
jgi:hypothetical protein